MMRPTYPHIDSLFKRDAKGKFLEEYSAPEFAIINSWVMQEKIDGTNIRFCYKPASESRVAELYIGGRTEDANLNADLFHYLVSEFPLSKFIEKFGDSSVSIYGEGIGPKILDNKYHLSDYKFLLFDVLIDGFWLERDNLNDIGDFFGWERPMYIGQSCSIEDIISYVKEDRKSFYKPESPMEGIIARPLVPLLKRNGERVIFKLKAKDFR